MADEERRELARRAGEGDLDAATALVWALEAETGRRAPTPATARFLVGENGALRRHLKAVLGMLDEWAPGDYDDIYESMRAHRFLERVEAAWEGRRKARARERRRKARDMQDFQRDFR